MEQEGLGEKFPFAAGNRQIFPRGRSLSYFLNGSSLAETGEELQGEVLHKISEIN